MAQLASGRWRPRHYHMPLDIEDASGLAGTAEVNAIVGRHDLAVQHVFVSFSKRRPQVHLAAYIHPEEAKKSAGAAWTGGLVRRWCVRTPTTRGAVPTLESFTDRPRVTSVSNGTMRPTSAPPIGLDFMASMKSLGNLTTV